MGEPDTDGRRCAEPVPGTEHAIEADAVIIAFGFRPNLPQWFDEYSIDTLSNGRVRTGGNGKHAFQTSNPKVFAGGDMVRGSYLVVTAVFEGHEAASSIVRHLEGSKP